MKIILLSGGSGKRLFPMSNDIRSKQFLQLLPDGNGARISMLQRLWSQLEMAHLADSTYICSSDEHGEVIATQIGEVRMIEEPTSRDTFPAIALSTLYLHDHEHVSDDEIILVMPVDPYVESSFFVALETLTQQLTQSSADLALIGVRPTSPSEKYGYIVVQPESDQAHFRVERFNEKPSEEVAKQLIAKGALWNCGVFGFRIGFLRTWLANHGYPTSYQSMLEMWPQINKISFDYEVVENIASSAIVVPYDGEWNDLGTWDALTSKVTQEMIGHGMLVNSTNTHVINELSVPAIVAGCTNLVVVATEDGILVSDKQQSVRIKEFSVPFMHRPMVVERRWGHYRILEHRIFDGTSEMLVQHVHIYPGHALSYHKHALRSEVWTIIQGSGLMASEKGIREISMGSVIHIEPHQWHAIKAIDQLEMIEVQQGSQVQEGDIIRRFLTWEEVEQYQIAQEVAATTQSFI